MNILLAFELVRWFVLTTDGMFLILELVFFTESEVIFCVQRKGSDYLPVENMRYIRKLFSSMFLVC